MPLDKIKEGKEAKFKSRDKETLHAVDEFVQIPLGGEHRGDSGQLNGIAQHVGGVQSGFNRKDVDQRATEMGCQTGLHSSAKSGRDDQVKGLLLHHLAHLGEAHSIVAVVPGTDDHVEHCFQRQQ